MVAQSIMIKSAPFYCLMRRLQFWDTFHLLRPEKSFFGYYDSVNHTRKIRQTSMAGKPENLLKDLNKSRPGR